MNDSKRTKAQLLAELEAMRSRLRSLEERPADERRTNYLLRIFIDALPNFGFSFTREGRLQEVLAGAQAPEARVLEGKMLSEILPPQDVEILGKALGETLESGAPQGFEFVMSMLVGRRWFHVKTIPVKDRPGEPDLAVFLFNDITNEKLAEGVLRYAQIELEHERGKRRKEESRFHALLLDSLQGILVQRAGRPLYANPSFARMFGFSNPEKVLTCQDLSVLSDPESPSGGFADWEQQTGKSQAPLQVETRVRKLDGSPFWVEVLASQAEWEDSPALWVTCSDITARKLAEEKAAESQEFFRSIVEHSPSLVVFKDLEGRFLMVSPYFAKMHGMRQEELVGVTASDLYPREAAEIFNELERQVIATRRPLEGVVDLPLEDGLHKLMTVKFPLYSSAGELLGTGTISTDITGRVRAEEELRRSEELFRSIVDHSASSIFLKDLEGRYTMVNRQFQKDFGLAAQDVIGKSAADLFPPDMAQAIAHRELEMQQTGNPVQWEQPFPGVDGIQWGIATKFPIRNAVGEQVLIGTIHTNITQRKNAEENLRRSEKRLSGILDIAREAFISFDQNGRIFIFNQEAKKTFGYAPAEILGKSVEILFPKNFRTDPAGIVHPLGNLTDGNRPSGSRAAFTGHRKDGKVFPAEGSISAWDEGIQTIFTIILRDVSDQKMLEEKLRQFQKLEAIGTLAGGIAHDFNNLLSPILGYTELAQGSLPPGSEIKKDLDMVTLSAVKAKELVAQILLFSHRGQTTKMVAEVESVVREVVKFARSTLPPNVALVEDISTGVPPILCDPSQIYQVLLNLCINASQAMPGGGRLEISLRETDLDQQTCFAGETLNGRHVALGVADTGVGMDAATLGHIFDPFFTTRKVGEGTGLGLATVFGIVQDHEGGIEVSSALGEGARFMVYFPVAEPDTPKPASPEPGRSGGTERILFVDDEVPIAHLGKVGLERLGFSVTSVTGGQEALTVFNTNPSAFDLVITDQSMPDMTGVNLIQELRKTRPEIPVILCTGHSETVTPETSADAGIDAFFYKPVSMNELGGAIRQLVDEKGLRRKP